MEHSDFSKNCCLRKTVREYHYEPCNSYFLCRDEVNVPVASCCQSATPTLSIWEAIRWKFKGFFRRLCCISIQSYEDDMRMQCKERDFNKNRSCRRYECKRY